MNYANQNNLTVITFNRDDFLELHKSGFQHSGIIICKTDRDYQGHIKFLHEYLQHQNSLSNRLVRIKKQNQKGLSQQVFIAEEY